MSDILFAAGGAALEKTIAFALGEGRVIHMKNIANMSQLVDGICSDEQMWAGSQAPREQRAFALVQLKTVAINKHISAKNEVCKTRFSTHHRMPSLEVLMEMYKVKLPGRNKTLVIIREELSGIVELLCV